VCSHPKQTNKQTNKQKQKQSFSSHAGAENGEREREMIVLQSGRADVIPIPEF